ncbi:MAG: hypothetical protein RLZ12_676 [Bacillota bacterium]|jgi:hypothetical protein
MTFMLTNPGSASMRFVRASGEKTSVSRSKVQLPIKAVYLGGYGPSVKIGDTENFKRIVEDAIMAGYNLLLLTFWFDNETGIDRGASAYYWQELTVDERDELLDLARQQGARILLAAGGGTYNGYQAGGGPVFGAGAAQAVRELGLDGLDFDLENFTRSFGTRSGLNQEQTLQWMIDATIAARRILGPKAIITHAPEAPYFSAGWQSGYLTFYKRLPKGMLDYFLVQYYNQGPTYLDYESQFIRNPIFPKTAIAELIKQGIPKEKIVMGKLTQKSDGVPNSWVAPKEIGQWLKRAAQDPKVQNYKTGVSTWQWHDTGEPTSEEWIRDIFGPTSKKRKIKPIAKPPKKTSKKKATKPKKRTKSESPKKKKT